MDWLLRTYGGTPSAWLGEPRQWVSDLLLLRKYRMEIQSGDG